MRVSRFAAFPSLDWLWREGVCWAVRRPLMVLQPSHPQSSCTTRRASSLPQGRGTISRRRQKMIRPGSDGDSGYWIPTICWSVCWAA